MRIKNFLSIAAITIMGVNAMAQKTELKAGETLAPGIGIFSKNGKYVLIMENSIPSGRYGMFSTFSTNNFSINRNKEMSSQPKTNLGKTTNKAQKLVLQNDGNLATYDYKDGSYIWDAQSHPKTADPKAKAAKMVVENDGTVSLYGTTNQKVWNSNSVSRPSAATPAPAPPPAPAPAPATVANNSVFNKMIALKSKYPHGMKWTDNNIVNGNSGCYAFSMILMDAAFGSKRPERKHTNFNDIKVGDMVRVNKNTHSMIVLRKDNKEFTFAEGNYGEKIHWGRTMTIAQLKNVLDYVLTSYP